MEIGNTEAVGGVVGALIAGALWLRKLKPQFAADDKVAATANADTGIIERLEKESKRLSEQNDKMANTLNEFQLQVIRFQTENNRLSMENGALRQENVALREEVMDLRKEVSELAAMVAQLQIRNKECIGCEHAK